MGNRRSWIRKGLAVAAFGAILMTSACGQSQGSSAQAATGGPQSGGTLRIAQTPDTLNCVDPFQTAWTGTRTVVRQFAQSLVDQDPDTGNIKPWLATDWKVSADGKQYSFNLKQGVTFSNGEAFNADAVVKTFNEDLQTLKEKPGTVGGFYVQNLRSVEKTGEYSVVFNFDKPNGSFLRDLATTTLAIIAPASTEKTPEERCLAKDLYGTGAFVIDKYDVNTTTELSKRKGFTTPSPFSKHQGDAYLDKIVVSYVPEDSVRVGNFVGGQTDVIWSDSDSQIVENDEQQIKQVGGSLQTRGLPGSVFNLFPNVRHGSPLADLDVRKAVSLGLDRKAYASTVIRPDYQTPKGVLGSTTPAFQSLPDNVKYDPDEAKATLDKAGWKQESDGYRYKNGRKLTLHYLTTQKDSGYELIQDELKAIGVDFQIDVVTNGESTSRQESGDYDFTSLTYTRADPSAANVLLDVRYATFKSVTGSVYNDQQRKVLEDYFDKGVAETDQTKRTRIYQDVQRYIGEQYLLIPVFQRVQDTALSSKVHDVRFTAESFGDFSGTWLG
ncbi:ABC transporter substrate-binding protein [Bifidobacterium margollesii]|uniref:ABC transporter substrate-binding protein n=1 Tax=Bifidobacterium margollesii TaxID=2020964 RepID=A0A2N5JBV9_9BIFI|nr:ABC transporter substrate-binding protein [Bifidobacterium margollesii]PLS31688.1 ABC transporter substrate-binding protein [Bifidobacterium margollesii]